MQGGWAHANLAALSEEVVCVSQENPTTTTTAQTTTVVGDAVQCKPVEVIVGEKGVERAIKHLKRKMAAEGILRELKRRRHYMKPSVKRRKKASEAARRRRKRAKTDVM